MLDSANALVRLKSGASSSSSGRGNAHSLFLWNILSSSSTFTATSYTQYICFRFSDPAAPKSPQPAVSDEASPVLWSHPVRLRVAPAAKRCTLALAYSSSESGYSTRACCLTTQQDSAIVYLTLSDDAHPGIEIHNNCDVPLYYGQAVADTAGFEGRLPCLWYFVS